MHSVIQDIAAQLIESKLAKAHEIRGCSEEEIRGLEQSVGKRLPSVYRDFLQTMGRGAGALLRGSDLWFDKLGDIGEAAIDLLEDSEDGMTLPETAFVFAMHQGYQFLYFLAGEGDDPEVFRFLEGEGVVTVAPRFSEWLRGAVEDESG